MKTDKIVLALIAAFMLFGLYVLLFTQLRKTEFTIHGKNYQTRHRCDSTVTYMEHGLHYEYSFSSGKYVLVSGYYEEDSCAHYVIDTIEISKPLIHFK